ncbi:OmpA family protein [Luteolibacter flavescens]|uniref:OmpA family protein n=1 Tax=Luteolibacter flavescens TaxID=1859460 RepID=A0ABT3FKI1_9BACT|nr:OmpA family protein [Luteolibacter flavescens]MCW1883957.1 OmpA family protein [Luteolibacter flavescens]
MQDSRFPIAFLVGALALAAGVGGLYMNRGKPAAPRQAPVVEEKKPVAPAADTIPANQKESVVDGPVDPEAAMANAGVGLSTVDPAQLLGQIGTALETGDFEKLGQLIGKQALDDGTRKRLAQLATQEPKLRKPDSVQEVGELELNKRARWALWLDGVETGRDRIFFDLQQEAGKWSVQSLMLPPAPGEPVPKAVMVDSLGIADAFLQALLHQQFELAKEFVDSATVSDAKIAGLCILFEDGSYKFRDDKPLRAMFQRPDTSGYLARVVAADGSDAAEFSMVLHQPENSGHWRVTDLNLDQLLADYAKRVAGGDVYYIPLVKNPKGGDTLVLYFGFDEDTLPPRTERQLDIVAQILKTDPEKQLTLSGHTDALGTEPYNDQLSQRRANFVKEYLVKVGVAEDQIITLAKGQSQPRRPNFTESGGDNPDGRRANRRAEIYLDFD